jgi:hypothetical protein
MGDQAPVALRREGVTEAIYGTLLAMSLISAWDEAHLDGLELTIFVTGCVFAAAHAFSLWLAGEVGRHGAGAWAAIKQEWPLAEACCVPALVIALGSLVLADGATLWVALLYCAAQLAAWSLSAARLRHTTRLQQAGVVAVALGIGYVMVQLKVIVH